MSDTYYPNNQTLFNALSRGPSYPEIERILLINPSLASKRKCKGGDLPLHYVLSTPKYSTQIILAILKSYPNAVGIPDNYGTSPLELAVSHASKA